MNIVRTGNSVLERVNNEVKISRYIIVNILNNAQRFYLRLH